MPRSTSLLLALALVAGASAQPTEGPAEGMIDPAKPPPFIARALAEQQAQKMYESAFKGEHTDEVATMMENHLAALMGQDQRVGAPRIADLLGGRAAIEFAAKRYGDGERQLRRLVDFSRLGQDDTLLMVGVRKTLAAAAYQDRTRRHEIKAMEKLKDELSRSEALGSRSQIEERLIVALLDCIGTAYMLDGMQRQAIDSFREAKGRGDAVYVRLKPPSELLREAVSVTCRLFPRAGLVSARLAMGDLEGAADASDQLIPLVGHLIEERVLPKGHPAREASEGAIDALREAYARVQAARIAKGETGIPRTLEERLHGKARKGLSEAEAGPSEPARPGPFAPQPSAEP